MDAAGRPEGIQRHAGRDWEIEEVLVQPVAARVRPLQRKAVQFVAGG